MPGKMPDKRKKPKRSKFSSEGSDSNSMSSSSSSSSSSDEETDAKDLKPIKEYLNNRKELASQLFKSVKTEKIRMMLPQILKKVELSDLEELCTAELIGMSKSRIMCILSGQEMLESSNTEESDGSGPSLEIISDTEWLSEEEPTVKIEGVKSKKDAKTSKKKLQEQKKSDSKSKSKAKVKGKVGKDGKLCTNIKLEKVKTEGKEKVKEKEKEKEKEGESLLDLLELEMRARAIRALIRKEEDASKSTQSDNTTNPASGSNDQGAKARQASLKEQLEKIDVLMKHGDDEDVFVVINPAPTIELLSSESENEDQSKRVNQKFATERTSKNNKIQEKSQSENNKDTIDVTKEKDKNKDPNVDNEKNVNKEKDIITDNTKNENDKESNTTDKSLTKDTTKDNENKNTTKELRKEEDLEDGEIIDDEEDTQVNLPTSSETKVSKKSKRVIKPVKKIINTIEDENDDAIISDQSEASNESSYTRKIKKVKKNPNIRLREKRSEDGTKIKKSNKSKTPERKISDSEKKNDNLKNDQAPVILGEPIEIEESPERDENKKNVLDTKENESDSISKTDLFDDKALDIEEIINLDDYPDDMDDLETNENNKLVDSISPEKNKLASVRLTSRSETWASRYYQQDDVQNVIKESKIQSEIRKRLRERQRQNKMNNSPKIKEQEDSQPSIESNALKPTGSVEEYLKLKELMKESIGTTSEEISDIIEPSTSLSQENFSTSDNSMLEKDDNSLLNKNEKDDSNELPVDENKILEQPNVVSTVIEQSLPKVVEPTIVIKKKPKLKDNITIVRKVDPGLNENIALQFLNKVIRGDPFPSDISKEQKPTSLSDEKSNEESNTVHSNLSSEEKSDNLPSSDETAGKQSINELPQPIEQSIKNIVQSDVTPNIEEATKINEQLSEKSEKTESTDSKKEISPLRDDECKIKSDSNDVQVIVTVDNSPSSDKRSCEVYPESNKRLRTTSSDLETSELRPD